jgi:hypothetical protein
MIQIDNLLALDPPKKTEKYMNLLGGKRSKKMKLKLKTRKMKRKSNRKSSKRSLTKKSIK